jgi:hypothetical protein
MYKAWSLYQTDIPDGNLINYKHNWPLLYVSYLSLSHTQSSIVKYANDSFTDSCFIDRKRDSTIRMEGQLPVQLTTLGHGVAQVIQVDLALMRG